MVSCFSYENEGLVSPTGSDSRKLARNFSAWSRAPWLLTWIQGSPKEGQQNQVDEDKSLHTQIKMDRLMLLISSKRTFSPEVSLNSKGFVLMCMCGGGERYLITAEQVTYLQIILPFRQHAQSVLAREINSLQLMGLNDPLKCCNGARTKTCSSTTWTVKKPMSFQE